MDDVTDLLSQGQKKRGPEGTPAKDEMMKLKGQSPYKTEQGTWTFHGFRIFFCWAAGWAGVFWCLESVQPLESHEVLSPPLSHRSLEF